MTLTPHERLQLRELAAELEELELHLESVQQRQKAIDADLARRMLHVLAKLGNVRREMMQRSKRVGFSN